MFIVKWAMIIRAFNSSRNRIPSKEIGNYNMRGIGVHGVPCPNDVLEKDEYKRM
ncbi:MAG: hypothetical protein WBL88_09370 [Nitrososphaeraceae archaeon]